jgi:geranylgeranyl diphosphate synthase type II
MRYSLLAPGKRLRPLLCLLAARAGGGDEGVALDAGCAIEMVHAASLILDDLPSMDDAGLRRGRQTAHLRFGEATAILAAIALLNRAYGVLAALEPLDEARRVRLVERLAEAVGSQGLAGGQEQDLNGRAALSDLERIDDLNALKTGPLFVLAAEFGGRLCGLEEGRLEPLRRFAAHLGLAFQTRDDLLDVVASKSAAAKDVGQDGGKPTVVSLAGCEAAGERIRDQLTSARSALIECRFENDALDRFLRAALDGHWQP